MRFLIEYWHRLLGAAAMPRADAVSTFDLKPALGHIVLIDVLDDGWDGRFRLYGTKIAETYGRDMTGRLVSEIDGGNYVSQFFRALYRSAWLRREGFFTHHFPPSHIAVSSWRSEEHTSELQSLMRISYAVFCLTKKKKKHQT